MQLKWFQGHAWWGLGTSAFEVIFLSHPTQSRRIWCNWLNPSSNKGPGLIHCWKPVLRLTGWHVLDLFCDKSLADSNDLMPRFKTDSDRIQGVERIAIMSVAPRAPFLESKYVPLKHLEATGRMQSFKVIQAELLHEICSVFLHSCDVWKYRSCNCILQVRLEITFSALSAWDSWRAGDVAQPYWRSCWA